MPSSRNSGRSRCKQYSSGLWLGFTPEMALCAAPQVPDNAIKGDILVHLKAFANQSRMRRMLLGLMANHVRCKGQRLAWANVYVKYL